MFLSITAFAQEGHQVEFGVEGDKVSSVDKKEISEFIGHHLQDSYDFNLFSWKGEDGHEHHFGFPLPVILYDNEAGLQVFMSSKLHHGEAVAHVGDSFYKVDHGKIYKTNAEGVINYGADHHATNEKPLDFSITKNVFMIFVVSLLMLWMFSSFAKSYKKGPIPTGGARFFEPIILYIRDDIAVPNIGEKKYKKYMPYLLTVFFFVWFLNLFGLTPLGVNVTGNITVTMSLALITFFITNITANKNYWGHIFWMPGVPVLMKFVLAPIELLGVFIKPFALMIRLYANMVAGHTVLMSIIGLMYIFHNWLGSSLSFGLAFALSILELLVAALQAYIFTMLSALYFGSANEEHHDDH
ncbi:MAG: F0F1 ATP synthase subunit A [Flavobacteriaceae bacterium]